MFSGISDIFCVNLAHSVSAKLRDVLVGDG